MDSFKNIHETFKNLSRNLNFCIVFSTLILLIIFLFSPSNKSPVMTLEMFTSWVHSSPNFSSFSSAILPVANCISRGTCPDSVTLAATVTEETHEIENKTENWGIQELNSSCDIFDGFWVFDDSIEPLYKPGSCPFIDDAFNCFNNGRLDLDYLKLRWKPHNCEIPKFDGLKMLEIIKGKRLVFVGDSLNRNMWESLICSLKQSLANTSRILQVSGRREFKTQGFYSFYFQVRKFFEINFTFTFILCVSNA